MSSAAEQLGAGHLKTEENPFGGGHASRASRPLQKALGEVIRHIGLGTPVIVVAGAAGTGKTMLMEMVVRACSSMGVIVRQLDRGDVVGMTLDHKSDVLVIDEADSIKDLALQALLSGRDKSPAATSVFLCLPSSVQRFNSAGSHLVELHAHSVKDAKTYLLERANSIGRTDLFTADALDLLICGSRGSPRMLRSIASLAYFGAASEGQSQIDLKRVAYALASQVTLRADKPESTPARNATAKDKPAATETETKAAPRATDTQRPPLKLVSYDPDKPRTPARWMGMRPKYFIGMVLLVGTALGAASFLASANNSGFTTKLRRDPLVTAPRASDAQPDLPQIAIGAPANAADETAGASEAQTALPPIATVVPTEPTEAADVVTEVVEPTKESNTRPAAVSRTGASGAAARNTRRAAPASGRADDPAAPNSAALNRASLVATVPAQRAAPTVAAAPVLATQNRAGSPAAAQLAAPATSSNETPDPYRITAEAAAAQLAAEQAVAAQAAAAQAAAAQAAARAAAAEQAAARARAAEASARQFLEASNRAAETAKEVADRERERKARPLRTLFEGLMGPPR